MLLPELQTMASSLGIQGTGRLRKGQLIAAIQNLQSTGAPSNGSPSANGAASPNGAGSAPVAEGAPPRGRSRRAGRVAGSPEQAELVDLTPSTEKPAGAPERPEVRTDEQPAAVATVREEPAATGTQPAAGLPRSREDRRERGDRGDEAQQQSGAPTRERRERGERPERGDRAGRQNARQDRSDRGPADRQGGRTSTQQQQQDDDDENSRRRGRFRERGRNRGRSQGGTADTNEPVLRDDDVLIPVAGILDVLDNYAFVRTSGYLTGPADVYVSLAQVRRYGLRRGDAITGVVRAPQEGEQRRDKYNALVRLDTINGMDPEEARGRPEFTKLTPLYPQDRLRMETEPHMLTTRVIDLVMPIGKGQRALIVSPPKAGKTMVLQSIANAITTNNPECHLMVVLVDERPEEVTDMQRSVKGEVIASTFDRPPSDHTNVAELSIERAKRLVELGQDVVVLLDSITRLGRAYNLAAPASGRILSGGVDSTALYPPKRFLGAARNIENGGSLTIIATALIETGSTMDTVIFEEFKGTGNAELKLDRKIADKRIFPAVDVDASGTRKEEILLAPDELAIVHKLRRVLHTREAQQAIELLLGQLKQTRTNYEFLMQIAKTTPSQD
jgi:transcription termination factor Rho